MGDVNLGCSGVVIAIVLVSAFRVCSPQVRGWLEFPQICPRRRVNRQEELAEPTDANAKAQVRKLEERARKWAAEDAEWKVE